AFRIDELQFKRESEKHWSASPLSTTIIAAIFGLLGTGVGAIASGVLNMKLEREKFEFTKELENQKSESNLILKAIETGDPEKALGSNRGPKIDEYVRSVGLQPEGQFPWQQAFVYWCFDQATQKAGVSNPVIKTAGVMDFYIKAGLKKAPRITQTMAVNNPKL